MEYDLQLIGARLQAARKAKGYTQDYVSARADITEKFLSQIERARNPANLEDSKAYLLLQPHTP